MDDRLCIMNYPRDLRDVVRDLLATEWARTTEDESLCNLIAELDESLSLSDRAVWIAQGQPEGGFSPARVLPG